MMASETNAALHRTGITGDNPSLSLVIPAFNEASNIEGFYTECATVLAGVALPWEMIFVNDGSSDSTLAALTSLHQQDTRVKIIDLSRNFGKEVALAAGIDFASGNAIIPIDCDHQHPPAAIAEMIDKWQQGAEIVFAVRRSRATDGLIKGAVAKLFYRVLAGITEVPISQNIGDFCLLDKKVADVMRVLPEKNRFMKGLFAWVGFRQDFVSYDVRERSSGSTKWNYWRLWNFAIDGITSFSTVPLRIWSYLGIGIGLVCFIYGLFIVTQTLVYGVAVPGYASLIVAVLFLGSMQLIGIGVIGEYIGRIYKETKSRPLYIINRVYGLDKHKE